MRPTPLLLALVAASLASAGCVDGAKTAVPVASEGVAEYEASPEQPQVAGDRGVLSGLVTDDELAPVARVEISLDGSPFSLLTNGEGRFEIRGLPSAEYMVIANKTGYQLAHKKVQVVAGEMAHVDFVLAQLVAQGGNAFHVVWPKKGMLECSWHVLGWSGACGSFEKNAIAPMPVSGPIRNPDSAWNYRVEAGVSEVYNEVVWQRASGVSSERLGAYLSYENRTTTHWYCSAEGPSPLRLQYTLSLDRPCPRGGAGSNPGPNEPTKIPASGQTVRTLVTAHACTTGYTSPQPGCYLSVAAQQSFDIWFSVFYGELAPLGYSALPP